MVTKVRADLLIVGMGAAAQLCALYAHEVNPELNILIVTKAVKGKGGWFRAASTSCSTAKTHTRST
jgi:succinate dehydrogenase/fumarate reductase flavoprotein subunit